MREYWVFVSLVVVLTTQAVYLTRRVWISWDKRPRERILSFILYANFLWALAPAIAGLATDLLETFNFGYELNVWSLGLSLEIIFFAIFIPVYSWRPFDSRADRVAAMFRETINPMAFIVILLIAGVAVYVLLLGPWTTSGYIGAGLYVKDELTSELFTIGGVQRTIYMGLIVPAFCILLFYIPYQRLPKWGFSLVAIGFSLVLLEAISTDSRGSVLMVLLGAMTCLIARGYNRRRLLVYALLSAVFVASLSGPMVAFRSELDLYSTLSSWERVQTIFQFFESDSSPGDGAATWATAFLTRLDSVQDGGILAHETARSHEFSYLRPFVGSFVGLFPRYLWADKPLPLSGDGTVQGIPGYLVMAFRDRPWNNASVTASGVAYWQFGWIGVIVTSAISAFIMSWLGRIAFCGGIAGLFFFLSFAMLTRFRLPVSLDETLLVFVQMMIPLLAFHAVYTRFMAQRSRRCVSPMQTA